MTDIKDILNQIIPKPTYFEIDEKDGTKIPFGSLSQLYTNCESYRLNFHCDRFFTNTNISDGLRCVKTKKSPSNSYPIGKYDKNNPFFIVFTNEQDLQSSMEPNIEVDWDYPLVVSDCCEDYRGAEEYFLVVEKEKIILKSRSERGLYYALVTLKKISEMTNGFLIPLKIHDAPKLHLRSVHMDLKRGVPKVSFLKEQAKILSEHKINSFMIEWEDKFPFEKELAPIKHKAALQKDEVKEWLETCHLFYIEAFPLIQSLGHFRYILSKKEFEHLNEMYKLEAKSRKEKHEKKSQMCPTNPKVKDFIWKLHTQIWDGMGKHKESRYVHIGMDETRNLGKCPRCKKIMEDHPEKGRSKLYIDHLNWIAEKYIHQNKIPIVWNDMIQQEFHLLAKINKKIWICDWEYNQPLPKMGKPVHERINAMDPTGTSIDWVRTREVKEPTTLKKAPPPSSEVFKKAWYIQNQKYPLRSFAYTKFFEEYGFNVLAAPAVQCCGLNPIIPCYAKRYPNIGYFNQQALEYNAQGSILTNWVIRYGLWPLLEFGFLFHAECAWNGRFVEEEKFFSKFIQNLFFEEYKPVFSDRFEEKKEIISNFFSNMGNVGHEYGKIIQLVSLNAKEDSGVDIKSLYEVTFQEHPNYKKYFKSIKSKIDKNHLYFDSILLILEYVELIKKIVEKGMRIEKTALNYDCQENLLPDLDTLEEFTDVLSNVQDLMKIFKNSLEKNISWYLHPKEKIDYLNKTFKPIEEHVDVLEEAFKPFYSSLKSYLNKIVTHSMKRFGNY